MTQNETYLVTGATGSTGKETVRLLRERGLHVRALVHRLDSRSLELERLGAEVMTGDLLDLESHDRSLEGVAAAYFVYPIKAGLLEATAYFAQAAIDAGVGAIVNMSQISARRDAASDAARQHWVAEHLLDRTGIPVTHLRPTFFAEWLLYWASSIAKTGRIRLPFGEGRHAPIAAEDQAKVIAAILQSPSLHAGRIYPIFGPIELSQQEIASAVGRVLGREVSYEPISIEAFRDALNANPSRYPQHLVQHLCEVARDYQAGLFAGTNDVVSRIVGTSPLGVEAFVTKHRSAFQ